MTPHTKGTVKLKNMLGNNIFKFLMPLSEDKVEMMKNHLK